MEQATVTPRFASINQVTRIYGFSRATANRRIADRTFNAVKAGSKVLIELASVDAYFASLPKAQSRPARC